MKLNGTMFRASRGSGLSELVLALPIALVGLALTIWFAIIGVEKLLSTYAMFMGIRAASVALDGQQAPQVAAQQAAAIYPAMTRWQQLEAPWRLGHVDQPYGRFAPEGDNPLQ